MELLDLPNELLEKILPFLPDIKDIRSIRLTCPRLRSLVADFVGINASVDLDEKDRGKRDFYSSVAIGEAKILNMTSDNFTLWKPTLLQKVTFDGNANPSCILNLLKDCENLKELDILSMMAVAKKPNKGLTRIRLPNLCSLELDQAKFAFRNPRHEGQKTGCNILRLLKVIDCPKLKVLWVTVAMDLDSAADWSDISRSLLAFVRNGNNLDTFRIHFDCLTPINSIGDEVSLENEMMIASKGRQLVELWISFNRRNDPWVHFLREQKSLQKLQIMADSGLNGMGPFELGVRNNAANLKIVVITFNFRPGERLDFSAFSGCSGLKKLMLVNANSIPLGDLSRDHFNNFNITTYCPNLEFFMSSHISISRENIRKILDLEKLTHLAIMSAAGLGERNLHLAPDGCANGVDLTLASRCVAKESIHCLLLAGMAVGRTEIGPLIQLLKALARNALDLEECVINCRFTRNFQTILPRRWKRGSGPHGFMFVQEP